MTTQTTVEADPITQVQNQIDAVQNGKEATPPQYVTTAMFNEMKTAMETQNQGLVSQVRGLQGRLDSDRAATQRSQETQIRAGRISQMKSNLDNVDDSVRPFAQNQIDNEQDALNRIQQQPAPQPESQLPMDQFESARSFVKDFGLDPSTAGIDYNLLVGTGTESERTSAFLKNLKTVEKGLPQPTQAPPSPPASPPVGSTPTAAGGVSTSDDLRDLFMTGNITADTYAANMAKIGQPVRRG
jgi:hypothetical protein